MNEVYPLEKVTEAYECSMSGKARFRGAEDGKLINSLSLVALKEREIVGRERL